METTFPWYHYQIYQMMFHAYPYISDQNNSYLNTLLDFGRNYFAENDYSISNQCHKNEEITQETPHHFNPITLKSPSDQLSPKNSQDLDSFRHKNKRHRKETSDQNEYIPDKQTSQILSLKANNSSLNQNRNILPNAIHQILSYVQRKNKSLKIVQKLVTKYAQQNGQNQENFKFQNPQTPDLSHTRFYAYQSQLRAKMPNYVKLETLKYMCTEQSIDCKSEVFSVREQMIYNKICQAVIIYYLKHQVVCVIMSSKRMQRDKKREHLKVNRKIEAYVRSGFQEEWL